MPRLTTVRPRLATLDTCSAKLPPKQREPFYASPEYLAWRKQVLATARHHCQAPGCTRSAPHHRMYADHIVERKDGGDPLDPANGQCLCAQHHVQKTNAERVKRMTAKW